MIRRVTFAAAMATMAVLVLQPAGAGAVSKDCAYADPGDEEACSAVPPDGETRDEFLYCQSSVSGDYIVYICGTS